MADPRETRKNLTGPLSENPLSKPVPVPGESRDTINRQGLKIQLRLHVITALMYTPDISDDVFETINDLRAKYGLEKFTHESSDLSSFQNLAKSDEARIVLLKSLLNGELADSNHTPEEIETFQTIKDMVEPKDQGASPKK